MIEDLLATYPPAVVWLHDKASSRDVPRSAAFVFVTPDGFAYVEPAYLDPYDCAHRFHRVEAKLTVSDGRVVSFDGPEWSGRLEPYTGSAAQVEAIGDGLERFPAELKLRKGRSHDEERERLRWHLAEDLV